MKKKISHTREPWGIEQTEATNWIGPLRVDGKKIDEVVCHIERDGLAPDSLARNDANARLIAAAPELLEGCKMMLSFLKRWNSQHGLSGKILRRVIRKATRK